MSYSQQYKHSVPMRLDATVEAGGAGGGNAATTLPSAAPTLAASLSTTGFSRTDGARPSTSAAATAPQIPKHLPGTPISYGSLVALESSNGKFLCLQRVVQQTRKGFGVKVRSLAMVPDCCCAVWGCGVEAVSASARWCLVLPAMAAVCSRWPVCSLVHHE